MVSTRVQPSSSGPASRLAGRGCPCHKAVRSAVAISTPRRRIVRGDGSPTTLTPRTRRRPSPVPQVSAHTMELPPTRVMRSDSWGMNIEATSDTSAIPSASGSVPPARSSWSWNSPAMRENSYQGIQVCHWMRARNVGRLIGFLMLCLLKRAFP